MHVKLLSSEAFFSPKCSTYRLADGFRPDVLGSLQRSPNHLAGFEGPSPKGRRVEGGEGESGRKGRGKEGGKGRVVPFSDILNTPLTLTAPTDRYIFNLIV